MKLEKQKNKNAKGFTLLETLVAISVLVIVLSALISLTVISLRSFEIAKQKYLAAKIAQEGIELLINKRDNNILCIENPPCSISNWQNNLIRPAGWEVDATKPENLLPGRRFRNYNSRNYLCFAEMGRFEYCGDPSRYISGDFTRQIIVKALGSEKISVKSVVRWQTKGIRKNLTIEAVLFGF